MKPVPPMTRIFMCASALGLWLNDLDSDAVRTDDEGDLHVLTKRVGERPRLLLELDPFLLHLRRRGVKVRKREAEMIDRSSFGLRELALGLTADEQPYLAVEETRQPSSQ